MKSRLPLAFLTVVALSLPGCKSPTDADPTPPEEEEEPGDGEGKQPAFVSFDGAPILV